MNQLEQIKETLRDLLMSQQLAVLATHHDGQPYASLVAFVATADLKELLFATSRNTRKFANLTRDSRVSLLVDSRSNRDADIHEAVAVTVIGTAAEVEETLPGKGWPPRPARVASEGVFHLAPKVAGLQQPPADPMPSRSSRPTCHHPAPPP